MSRITFGQAFEPQPAPELIPKAFLANNHERFIAQWRHDRVLAFIQQPAYQAMHAHANTDPRYECTGLMVGQVFYDPEYRLPFVLIEQTFPLNATEHSGAHVHVDAARLAQTQTAIQRQHPGTMIVGWYHTHPNLGVYLSATDRQVTEGLFNASWHVATVIDPMRKEEVSFVARGKSRISGLMVVARPTPITHCMSLYRHAEELIAAQDFSVAESVLQQLQQYFHEASASSFQSDLRHWLPDGTYRDLSTLLSKAKTHQIAQQSGAGDGQGLSSPSFALERQLQDLQRGQTELAQELKQINNRLAQPTRRSFTIVDLIGLLLGLTLAILLGTDIYVQQLRTQALIEQNQHLAEVSAQNHALEQTLLLLATPASTAIPASATPTTTAEPVSATPTVPPMGVSPEAATMTEGEATSATKTVAPPAPPQTPIPLPTSFVP